MFLDMRQMRVFKPLNLIMTIFPLIIKVRKCKIQQICKAVIQATTILNLRPLQIISDAHKTGREERMTLRGRA